MGWNQWQKEVAPLSRAHAKSALAILSGFDASLVQE